MLCGVIAEFNPFHNGHRLLLQRAREAGATHIAVVMSPDFVQRGEPAMLPKWVRAQTALQFGADLVLELPLPYACAAAERFAFGGVSLLDALGCVDMLAFGSETADIDALKSAARAVDSPEVSREAVLLLSQGTPYAAAIQSAVRSLFGGACADALSRPNDILAVEYLRRLDKLGSRVSPVAIRREGAGHDGAADCGDTASSGALRGFFACGQSARARPYMPTEAYKAALAAIESGSCAERQYLERPMLSALRQLTPERLRETADVSEGLENRILAAARTARSLDELLDTASSKRYTRARLRRALLSADIGIPRGLSRRTPPYIRLLGIGGRGREILAAAAKTATLPISGSAARLRALGGDAAAFIELEGRASDLYSVASREISPCGADYTHRLLCPTKGGKTPC